MFLQYVDQGLLQLTETFVSRLMTGEASSHTHTHTVEEIERGCRVEEIAEGMQGGGDAGWRRQQKIGRASCRERV